MTGPMEPSKPIQKEKSEEQASSSTTQIGTDEFISEGAGSGAASGAPTVPAAKLNIKTPTLTPLTQWYWELYEKT